MPKTQTERDSEVAVDFFEPDLYRVLLLNDNFTTMDFVVTILKQIFHKSDAEAEKIMLDVHKKGSGTCGIYPFTVAEAKVAAVRDRAGEAGFPLRCLMENA